MLVGDVVMEKAPSLAFAVLNSLRRVFGVVTVTVLWGDGNLSGFHRTIVADRVRANQAFPPPEAA